MKSLHLFRSQTGMALPVALVLSLVIISLGAGMLLSAVQKHRVVYQTASWKEALLSADAGVDMAMSEIRSGLRAPDDAWLSSTGWSKTTSFGTSSGQNYTTTSYSMTSQILLRGGEGGQRSWVEVTVDAPSFLRSQSGEQWYRIRSRGIAEVPGGRVVAGDKQDLRLRKFDLIVDHRTQAAVANPRSSRSVEAIAKPVGVFRFALFGITSINLTDQNIIVDSYDSRDAKKSTNGRYDPAKYQQNGDIATDGPLIEAGNALIRGDAYTNGGTVLNAQNVTGEIRDDFYQDVMSISAPTTSADPSTPSFIDRGANIDAKANTPTSYRFSSLKLTDNQTLRIKGAPNGNPTYCQIVVTGDIDITGSAQIILDKGVNVRLYVMGDANINGSGIANNGQPVNFQIYGCDRPVNADGSIAYGKMNIIGNGGFTGAVYAPQYDISIKGGGNSDTVFGAFVGNTIFMNGVQTVHYDEALSDGGLIADYKIVSWFEDER